MPNEVFPLLAAAATVAALLHLLRRRQLREKYAILWLLLAVGVAVLAVFPGVLAAAAGLLGVKTPSNRLFFVAALVLLVVSVQLSWEVSRLEDETRALAEEVALVRLMVERGSGPSSPAP